MANDRYFVSEFVDKASLFLLAPFVAAVLLMTTHLGAGFLIVAIAFAFAVDMPHVVHTYLVLAVSRDSRSKYGKTIVLSFLGIVTLVVMVGQCFGISWLGLVTK